VNASLSLVIPVFNEEETVPELVDRCVAACEPLDRAYEILLVDDGSTDASRERIAAKAREYGGRVKGVFLNRNYGQHSAVICGLAHAQGDTVVTLDADLQNPPEEIPRLVAKADEGYDVVGTVRVNRRDSLFRRLASHLINTMVKRSTGVSMHDYGCMLRAYDRKVVKAILECRERSTFVPVLANGFARRTVEIDVRHEERKAGTSKYGVMRLVNLMFDLMTCMTTGPLRLLTILGGLLSAAGIAFGLLLFTLRLAYGAEWAGGGVFTLFAVAFFLMGAQFVALGLLGEYIGRIHIDVRERPRYFVDRTVGTTGARLEWDPETRPTRPPVEART
jgi:undecaprenyl-phosphate 4-deoxy-4-formamido-L-arabinose transferase